MKEINGNAGQMLGSVRANKRSTHPLLTKLMRAKLSEHSAHLESQHSDVADDDDDADDRETYDDATAEANIAEDDAANTTIGGGGGTPSRLARASSSADASSARARVSKMLSIEDDAGAGAGGGGSPTGMAKTFAGLIDASKRQLDANRGGASGSRRGSPSATVDGGARLSSSTRAPTAGPRAAFGSSFFGHFKWNIGGPSKPKEPEMTKPRRWPRLSKLQAVTLFDRLYASRPKTPPRDDPDETFAPKISAKTKRLAAAVRAKENQGVDRIEYLHNKGTKEIREVNDKKLLAEGWMHSDEASVNSHTIDATDYACDRYGRPGKGTDRYLAALRDEEDQRIAAKFAFKPKLSAKTKAIIAAAPRSSKTGSVYERNLDWLERRNRAAAAAAKAKEDEGERECTFQPRTATTVPRFVRDIAAEQRTKRLGVPRGFGLPPAADEGVDGALVAATSRPKGWLSAWAGGKGVARVGNTFSDDFRRGSPGTRSQLARPGGSLDDASSRRPSGAAYAASETTWDASEYGGDGESGDENARAAAHVVGGVALPSALPTSHPFKKRESKHVPLKSALSSYRNRHKGEGANAVSDTIEAARLKGETETRATDLDYFERVHLERAHRARLIEREKLDKLNKSDGSGWRNRVTKPKAFTFGKKPDMSKVKSLRRPLDGSAAEARSSLANSVSNLARFRFDDASPAPTGRSGGNANANANDDVATSEDESFEDAEEESFAFDEDEDAETSAFWSRGADDYYGYDDGFDASPDAASPEADASRRSRGPRGWDARYDYDDSEDESTQRDGASPAGSEQSSKLASLHEERRRLKLEQELGRRTVY